MTFVKKSDTGHGLPSAPATRLPGHSPRLLHYSVGHVLLAVLLCGAVTLGIHGHWFWCGAARGFVPYCVAGMIEEAVDKTS